MALLEGKRFSATPGQLTTAIEHHDDGTSIYHARGELDLSTIEDFSLHLEEALAATDSRLVVDLAGVTFCNASGLAALLNVRQRAAERGIRMTLRHCAPMVQRVITICDLETLLPDDRGG